MSPAKEPVQNPLTLMMTIKSEEDYQALNGVLLKFDALPPEENPVRQALSSIGTVHFARFVFMENNTKLAVITTYDGTFESYVQDFVENIGQIFDVLLSHMKDAPPLPVREHRAEFLAYVKANDLPDVGVFYSAYPDATVLTILDALE
jgi:hypothetical protein